MCYIVLPQRKVQKLCVAAQNIQSLLSDGTLGDAFNKTADNAVTQAVTGFDVLAENVTAILAEQKPVSPFLRYRTEILGQYDTAECLRALVLNLWGGRPCNLSWLFMQADEHHTRIALDLIASYAHYGENDGNFMALAGEIIAAEPAEVEA